MVKKTNNFSVKNIKDNKIVLEEERKERSPLSLFFIKNGKLIFAISFLFSITIFIIAFYLVIINIEESSIVMYESNGVQVTFNSSDNSILNGTPITDKYAEKVFESVVSVDNSKGVVIEVDRKDIKIKEKVDRTIVYYSDGTTLIKYNNNRYMWVSSLDGKHAVDKKSGNVDSRATIRDLSGRVETNKELGITFLYLSDGSIEVTKDNTTFYVRNSDITNTKEEFYTNLSGVSLAYKKENGNIYYSDGTIKENNGIIVDGKRYESTNKINAYDNIKIIYYENGYAEVIKDNFSIIVRNSDHIIYDNNNLEIIYNNINSIEIKDIMDVKEIELKNTNDTNSHYIVVLEETDDYKKYDVNKRLDNNMIHFNVYINGNRMYNNILSNNLKDSEMLEGIDLNTNTYLIHEGTLEKLSSTTIKLGLWIDYVEDRITNEYMNSAFIGTIKVYVESIK